MSWTQLARHCNHEITESGEVRNKISGRVLTGSINNRGYRTVHIGHNNTPEFVHRLIAETFVPNDDPMIKTDVNHIDGNKLNNSIDNLEWVTRSENVKHAYVNGLNRPSGGSPVKNRVRVIETGSVYDSQADCARAIGGSTACISTLFNGKRKKDTYCGYHFERV